MRAGEWHRWGFRRRWALLASALGLLLVMILSACGASSSSSDAPTNSENSSNLLGSSELSEFPRGSVKSAFLDYWSSLQYRSWADAAAYYGPSFLDFVGTAKVISAKKHNSSAYPLMKPKIVRVTSKGGNTTINYTLLTPEGITELDSITWRKVGDNWEIVYDSRLDAELGQDASRKAEVETSGGPPTGESTQLSPEAVRAADAAEELQAKFLQKELKTSVP